MNIARILLVEDDPVSREVITALLVSRGHTVDAVDDGFGALRLAQERSYDLVFVDYHLPEMDGYALARLMRLLSETASGNLKMVAITADQFGLAARRSIDTLFDRVLTKPIEPDSLFAFLDEFLVEDSCLDDLEDFLATPDVVSDLEGIDQISQRVEGTRGLPLAAVFPPPNPRERAGLERCFQLVDAHAADSLILLRQSGLRGVEAVRAHGKAYLQPLFVLDPGLSSLADVSLDVGSDESWLTAISTIKGFAARATTLNAEVVASHDIDTRVAAYLFVADRTISLCRGSSGQTSVPYTAGFSTSALIEAVKRLAARGLVSAKPDAATVGTERQLVVRLTPKGLDFLSAAENPLRTAI